MDKSFAYSKLVVKAVDDEQRIISGMATTPEPDRDGDIIDPMGVKFNGSAPLLWMHRHDLPVGSVEFGKPTKDGVPFTARLPKVTQPIGLASRIEEAWQSVKSGIVRAVSVGFRPLEWSVIEETGGYRFTSIDLYELSLVSVPAQPNATITQVKAYDATLRASMSDETDKGVKTPSEATEKKSKTIKISKHPLEGKIMDLNEKLKGFKAERAAKAKKMDEMMEKSLEGGETFDAAQDEEYETLEAEVKALDSHIEKAEKLMATKARTATPVTEKAGQDEDKAKNVRSSITVQRQPKKLEKGIAFARYVMALVKAKGDEVKAASIAARHFGEEDAVTNVLSAQAKGFDMTKAAIEAGSTLTGSDATWGSALVDYQDFTGDFIEFLRPMTIIGKFGNGDIPGLRRIPFNVTIKGQNAGATASWVGEGVAKPVTSMGFNTVNLGWFKVAAIAVITDELVRFSDPNAERLVRDELARAVVERIDTDFINPAKSAVAGVSPASILNGVAGIPSVGTDYDAVMCDIEALEDAFVEANNQPDQGVFIMRPGTANRLGRMQNALGQNTFPGISMRGGTLLGTPVIVSNYVPEGVVALVNAGDIYLADDGQVSVDASREASILMDTAPAASMDSVTPNAAELVSMYQTNSVAVRAERYVNWARRRDSGVAYLTGVDWSNCVESA